MADDDLYFEVLERLYKDAESLGDAAPLVEGALSGPEALAKSAKSTELFVAPAPESKRAARQARGVWLTSLTVMGFRGIGPAATLSLDPSPGLVVVTGRNGSGKSSLAEGLEVLLTGDGARFQGRSKIWREGWRNLGVTEPVVRGRFAVEGRGNVTVERRWATEADLATSTTSVDGAGDARDLRALGWEQDLVNYRPILATSELARMHDGGPTSTYDALKGILGLDLVAQALATLAQARKDAKRSGDEAKDALAGLRTTIAEVEDLRAEPIRGLLAGRKVDPDAVLAAVGPTATVDPDLARLRRAAEAPIPDVAAAAAATQALRGAVAEAKACEGTAAEVERLAADALDAALRWHDKHGDGDCPVCGTSGAVDASWRDKALSWREQRQAAARESSALAEALRRAERVVRVFDPSSALTGDALADHVDALVPALAVKAEADRQEAQRELAAREDRWTPIANQLVAWAERAKEAARSDALAKRFERAEKWLKDLSNDLRDERFRPLAHDAQEIWERLRQQSSVALVKVALSGSGNQRKVDLDVTVDGEKSVALSVMSQGELNALALALFLPRAMSPASPFRFLVVDDPIQSMDPAKVDGLAQVLQRVAQRRQVIVFSHDPRLPEAVRRLQIPARIVEVGRRSGTVQVRDRKAPTEQYLHDAEQVARAQGLGPRVGRRVVPGLCKLAVEAALVAEVRRRRLGRGDRHEDVEDAVARARTVHSLAALAMFDDEARGADVLGRINAKISRDAGDAFQALKQGAHQPHDDDLFALVDRTRRLVAGLSRCMP